jgi:hypothetical protein
MPGIWAELKIEGRYLIMTSEKGLSVLNPVALYKELTEGGGNRDVVLRPLAVWLICRSPP